MTLCTHKHLSDYRCVRESSDTACRDGPMQVDSWIHEKYKRRSPHAGPITKSLPCLLQHARVKNKMRAPFMSRKVHRVKRLSKISLSSSSDYTSSTKWSLTANWKSLSGEAQDHHLNLQLTAAFQAFLLSQYVAVWPGLIFCSLWPLS